MTDGRMAIRKRKRTFSKVSHSLKKWKVTPHKGDFVNSITFFYYLLCNNLQWIFNYTDGRDLDNRDIIQRLDSYMLHGVVEQIFGYVDYDSLVNAQRVSPEWRTILENEKIWKALLRRNVRFDQSWRKMFHQLKIQATNGASNANDETFITKKICIQIG